MKSKKLSSLIGALSCAIFLAACSNASGGGGTSASADIFASAKTALRAMDVSMDLSSSNSGSLVSKSVKMGEIVNVNDTLPADKFFGIDETDKIGQGIAIYRRKGYDYDSLSGKTSESQCILEMCKKEVPEQITNLDFNKDYTQEVTGNYTIGSNSMTVVVKKFRVNHVKGSDEMMVFSVADVYAAADTQKNTNYGPYNSILKCKKNAFDALDTELYMFNQKAPSMKYYKKFVRDSSSKKTYTSFSTEKGHWEEMSITEAGITGYKRTSISGRSYINMKGDYSAIWSCSDQNFYSTYVLHKDGRVIKTGYFNENKELSSYIFFLNFITDLTGYSVKKVDNATYKLVNANGQEVAPVSRIPFNNNGSDQPDAYTYSIYENDMKSKGLSCSVASQIESMSESVKNHELKAADYISESCFDSSLPTVLASWLSN